MIRNCIYFSTLNIQNKEGKKSPQKYFLTNLWVGSLKLYSKFIPDSESKPLWNHISLTEIRNSEKEKPKAIVGSLLLHFNLASLLGFPSSQLKLCQSSLHFWQQTLKCYWWASPSLGCASNTTFLQVGRQDQLNHSKSSLCLYSAPTSLRKPATEIFSPSCSLQNQNAFLN